MYNFIFMRWLLKVAWSDWCVYAFNAILWRPKQAYA